MREQGIGNREQKGHNTDGWRFPNRHPRANSGISESLHSLLSPIPCCLFPTSLFPIVCCLFLLTTAPCLAQQQIPTKSLESIQETFSIVRDKLWVMNDDFWHTGQHNRCIAMMRLIAQIDPHDFDAYEDAAWLMESALRDDEAEAFLLQGLWNNPDNYEMYSTLGHFCYTHERFDESIAYYEEAVSLDAPNLTWHMLAHAYEHGGYINESLNVWLGLEAVEAGNVVPKMQIDRILKGEPPPDIPGFLSRAREERRR